MRGTRCDVAAGVLPVIAIDRGAVNSLHKQIYDGYRAAIVRGDLRPGQQLPSTRDLVSELHVSRTPVLNAYAQLIAEGYFESRAGAGTFVSSSLPDRPTALGGGARQSARINPGPRPVARRTSLLHTREVAPWRRGWGAFGAHQPALDQFPFQIWSNLAMRHSRSPRASALHRIDPLGSIEFRDAICTYLKTARAVRCDVEQIMIVAGSQQALDISARVLLDAGSRVWVEEPGYRLTRDVLTAAGCRLIPVPVDSEGMNVAAGIKRCRTARAAYVAPSHQYPLGATMSASRRFQLLDWAQSSGSWIIEDDYDSEYRYESQPIASLQGLDHNARVIYIGTFSKVLFPTLRLGYIVIPPDLVDHFAAIRFAMDLGPPYFYQELLTDFMREGHFARHIRKMRLLYNERRSALVDCIRNEFGSELEIQGAEAGMHLTVTLPAGFNDRQIAMRAASQGLWLWPLSPSYLGENPRQGLILGFGSTMAAEMPGAVRRLRNSVVPD
ncbi:MAG TPA: PLP-dependent aminotransferase family protein [Silvibacterium sp.]|nr:PLP-dependent aminotransferase family protein [Silvibacterium sp.]